MTSCPEPALCQAGDQCAGQCKPVSMNSKQTPKSCTCRTCALCKRTEGGKETMKFEERAHRHQSNQALRQGKDEDILPATHGSRIG